MSKKTALDLACEELNYLIYSEKTGIGCGDCPAVKDCELNCESYSVKNCTKNLKQHFQEQADIPDGWDVVKKIHKALQDLWLDTAGEDEEFAYGRAIYCVKDYLEEAGIEVNDESF